MIVQVFPKDIRAVNETPIIQQTAFWSDVKNRQGIRSCAFSFRVHGAQPADFPAGKDVPDDLLVLLQQLNDGYSMAYVPYGPEMEPEQEVQGAFLEELSEALRSFLPSNCIMIRYDLAWQSHWAQEHAAENGGSPWQGPPEKTYQEFRVNFGTRRRNLRKANTNILPANTVFLDINRETHDIQRSMKPKTRYNINLSLRKGVTVRSAGMEELSTWYALYKQTAARNRIHLNGIDYFRSVLAARAGDSCSPASVEFLLAELNNQPLAAMFLVLSGNRGTYLYGASSDTGRSYMPTYALQWAAINIARAKGCTEYDLFGVAPAPDPAHPMYGLYKFKTGFGGTLFHRMGCWDYPLRQEAYHAYCAAEISSKGYHL